MWNCFFNCWNFWWVWILFLWFLVFFKFLLARGGIFAWKCGKNPRHWAVDGTEVSYKVQWGYLSPPKDPPNHSTLAHSEYCLQMEWSPLWCQESGHMSRVSLSLTYDLLKLTKRKLNFGALVPLPQHTFE